MQTTIRYCIFKRKKDSREENGIMFGEGDLIIDMQLKPVKAPIWDWRWDQTFHKSMVIPIELYQYTL